MHYNSVFRKGIIVAFGSLASLAFAEVAVSAQPLTYGSEVSIQNKYGNWGSFLDTNSTGCEGNKYCVSASEAPDRAGVGTGIWRIVATDGKAEGSPVNYGDEIHIQNKYANWGSFLDTNRTGCEGNKYCVSASEAPDRARVGTGIWRIVATDGKEEGSPVNYGDEIHIQNKYANWGSFLDTNGRGCEGNKYCVSASAEPDRASQGTATWRFGTAPGPGRQDQLGTLSSATVTGGSAASTWQAPTGDFPFFDEEAKAGDTLSTAAPAGWLTTATKDWMARLPDNTQLRQISIPGTHDSGARFGGAACETQAWTIRQQLDAGIRYLDIRNRRTGTSFAIHHGACYQNMMFGDVMDQISGFLTEHPRETILMRVKEEHDPQDNSSSFSDIWDDYMLRYSGLFAGSKTPSATLGTVRGKVVVLRNADIPESYGMRMFGNGDIDIQDTYKVYWLANNNPFGAGTASLGQKNDLVRSYIDAAAAGSKLIINHLSGAVGMIPKDVAGSTNAAAFETIGSNPGKKILGVLAMDFPGDKIVYRTIKTNFASTVSCPAQSWATYSDASYARFNMPTSKAGTIIKIKGGAYNHYVFPKCNRATWTDLSFSCGTNGKWTYTGSWDADALCHDSNTTQTYLEVGKR